MAHALAFQGGNLAKQSHHVRALHGEEANLVFKGSHLKNMTKGDLALWQRGTHATYIIYTKVRPFAVFVSRPYEDVAEKV